VKIGIIGGTGDIGEGMALRLSPLFEVIVGSRNSEKAIETSVCCSDTLHSRNVKCSCSGTTNADAVLNADVIILAVPWKNLTETVRSLPDFGDKIVVSPVNPMEKRDHFVFVPPDEGSVALYLKRILPPEARLVVAFNTIAANRWKAIDEELRYSVPVCGDDLEAKSIVSDIVNSTSALKAYDAGPLAASCMVESLTPLLLNIARYNKMRDVGLRFV